MKKSLYVWMVIVSTLLVANDVKGGGVKQKEDAKIVQSKQLNKGIQEKTATTVTQKIKKQEYPRGTISTH